MGDDVVLTYLRRKLHSNLEEAGKEAGRPTRIISRFRSLEDQISEKSSTCPIPVVTGVLYDVIGALSEWRASSYERHAVSKKGLIHVIHRRLSEFLFERKMSGRFNDIAEKLQKLSPAADTPVVKQSETTEPISEIFGFEEEMAKIEELLKPSSANTLTEIAIVGKWGCGKTALAQKVFASPRIKEEFSPLIWVCLSGTMPISQEPVEAARERVVKYIKEKIGQDVWDELNGKRYLMVLDDASWHWPGLDLDLPKGGGGAIIVTTRRNKDFGTHTNVIPLKPQLSNEICWQIFSNISARQQAKLDYTELQRSTIRNDVTRISRGRPLAVKSLGIIIPDLLQQRNHWVRARDLGITWGEDARYWKWTNEGMEEVAELKSVYWLEIKGSLELHKLLLGRSYSAYLVYKLKDKRQRYNLDVAMAASVRIVSNGKEEEALPLEQRTVYIDGDLSQGKQTESGWMEIELGEFLTKNNFRGDGSERVEAKLFEKEGWKSGLIVMGISFRLNDQD